MNLKRFGPVMLILTSILFAATLACGKSSPLPTAPSLIIETATLPIIPAAPLSVIPTTPPIFAATQQPLASDMERSLLYDGLERTYLLHLPADFTPDRSIPVVLVFHGFGLDGQEMVHITGFNARADTENFVVVYPDGTGRNLSWNGGVCCGEAAARHVDDVGFVRALIDDLSKVINLDRSRVYATGFSNGAIMAYRLACDLADQIAAVGPVAAAQATQTCQPARPMPVIHFHGDEDRLNPYEGGVGPGGGLEFMPVEETIQFWVSQNGCRPEVKETKTGNIVHRIYSPCTQSADVELYKVLGGEHAWPGGQAVSPEVGEPTDEIDATALMWSFFAAHPMP
jgi:polyhydroxybutyrate depolymerase